MLQHVEALARSPVVSQERLLALPQQLKLTAELQKLEPGLQERLLHALAQVFQTAAQQELHVPLSQLPFWVKACTRTRDPKVRTTLAADILRSFTNSAAYAIHGLNITSFFEIDLPGRLLYLLEQLRLKEHPEHAELASGVISTLAQHIASLPVPITQVGETMREKLHRARMAHIQDDPSLSAAQREKIASDQASALATKLVALAPYMDRPEAMALARTLAQLHGVSEDSLPTTTGQAHWEAYAAKLMKASDVCMPRRSRTDRCIDAHLLSVQAVRVLVDSLQRQGRQAIRILLGTPDEKDVQLTQRNRLADLPLPQGWNIYLNANGTEALLQPGEARAGWHKFLDASQP